MNSFYTNEQLNNLYREFLNNNHCSNLRNILKLMCVPYDTPIFGEDDYPFINVKRYNYNIFKGMESKNFVYVKLLNDYIRDIFIEKYNYLLNAHYFHNKKGPARIVKHYNKIVIGFYLNSKSVRLFGPSDIWYDLYGNKIREYFNICGNLHNRTGPALRIKDVERVKGVVGWRNRFF